MMIVLLEMKKSHLIMNHQKKNCFIKNVNQKRNKFHYMLFEAEYKGDYNIIKIYCNFYFIIIIIIMIISISWWIVSVYDNFDNYNVKNGTIQYVCERRVLMLIVVVN